MLFSPKQLLGSPVVDKSHIMLEKVMKFAVNRLGALVKKKFKGGDFPPPLPNTSNFGLMKLYK